MGDNTAIEWSEATWNPVVGCSVASPGCDNCYAARETAGRLSGLPQYKGLAVRVDGVPQFTGEVRCLPERLDQPLKWKRPRRVFVNSMSDLFHPDVPDEFIEAVFFRMHLAKRHTFQILTKRPKRMARISHRLWVDCNADLQFNHYTAEELGITAHKPLANVWLGTSIESDRYIWRADAVRGTNAAVRFLSLEPLLGPLPSLDLTGIDWVIVGGESGPRARPMHPDWVRLIRDQCVAAGVPFFFKQWGEFVPAAVVDDPQFAGGRAYDDPHGGRAAAIIREPGGPFRTGDSRAMNPGDVNGHGVMLDHDTLAVRVGKKAAGRMLDGRTWDEYPA